MFVLSSHITNRWLSSAITLVPKLTSKAEHKTQIIGKVVLSISHSHFKSVKDRAEFVTFLEKGLYTKTFKEFEALQHSIGQRDPQKTQKIYHDYLLSQYAEYKHMKSGSNPGYMV